MAENYNAITDGTYVLSESDVPNQFYFYREDHEVLTDIDHEPMDLYHAYIFQKMIDGEISGTYMGNICFEYSDDNKCIRLTVTSIGDSPTGIVNNSACKNKKPNFFKRWLNKIFK